MKLQQSQRWLAVTLAGHELRFSIGAASPRGLLEPPVRTQIPRLEKRDPGENMDKHKMPGEWKTKGNPKKEKRNYCNSWEQIVIWSGGLLV